MFDRLAGLIIEVCKERQKHSSGKANGDRQHERILLAANQELVIGGKWNDCLRNQTRTQ